MDTGTTRRDLLGSGARLAGGMAAAWLGSGTVSAGAQRQADRTGLWQRSGRNVIAGFHNMYNLHVLRMQDRAYPYRGWFFGWAAVDGNRNIPGFTGWDAIFAARAHDLDGPWHVWCGDGAATAWDATSSPALWRPVVAPRHLYYDEVHNGDPSVVNVGATYYMAYSSVGNNRDRIPYGSPGDRDGSLLCIMGATSDDGLHWKRSEAPILLHAEDVGAAPVPEGEAHLYGSFNRPSLMAEGGKFRLWFDYWAGASRGVSMGYAECRGDFLDPAAWKVARAGDRPCLPQFPNPDVVRAGGLLHAFGDPPIGGTHPFMARKITEAVSANGLDWVVLGHTEPESDAAACHVPEAFVEHGRAGDTIHLFYACQNGGEPYDYRYSRIRRMSRIVTPAETARLRALLK